MKHIITCIFALFVTGMMAQTAPNEARTTNITRNTARPELSKVGIGVSDGPAVKTINRGSIGIDVVVVDDGVEIKEFDQSNSSARAAKMQIGDIITAINSKKITNENDIKSALASYTPGDVVTIHYTRGVRKLTKEVRINRK